MLWMMLGAAVAIVLLVVFAVRPLMNRRKEYDAGSVSEYWIQQHRGRSQDASR